MGLEEQGQEQSSTERHAPGAASAKRRKARVGCATCYSKTGSAQSGGRQASGQRPRLLSGPFSRPTFPSRCPPTSPHKPVEGLSTLHRAGLNGRGK